MLQIIVSVWLLCGVAYSNERPLYHFSADQSWTSDKIFLHHRHLAYRNHRRDMSWPYKGSAKRAWDWGVLVDQFNGASQSLRFEGLRYSLLLGQKVSSSVYWEVEAGAHQFQHDLRNEALTVGTGAVKLHGYLFNNRKYYATYSSRRDFSYSSLRLPAALSLDLMQVTHDVSIHFKPSWQWRVIYLGGITDFSDDNRREENHFQLLYGISPGWPWIWTGLVGEHLTTRKNVQGYWTPDKFTSYGAKLEASFPIFYHVTGITEFQWRKLREDNYTWGNGRTTYLGIQYGDRNEFHLRLSYMKITGSQENREWTQNSYFLTVGY